MSNFNLRQLITKTAQTDRKLPRNAERVITLLENARDLAVTHQQRTDASRVVTAAAEIARSLHQPKLQSRLLDLASAVMGKNNIEMGERFDFACQDVLKTIGT